MPSPETCLSEWLTCSVTDDHALPCCDGLYCAIESDYYAQCQEIVNETSTPAHTSAYECGTSIADTSYVTSEYSNWVKSYILDTGVGLCVDQPDQGSKCVSEVNSVSSFHIDKHQCFKMKRRESIFIRVTPLHTLSLFYL
mmetsp:Transcript_19778/g.25800  ORF Transcript_19778/g.25800 Transcript_19778/m.25800 type:complete len:140 (+) Transcript_19778:385-804(+)